MPQFHPLRKSLIRANLKVLLFLTCISCSNIATDQGKTQNAKIEPCYDTLNFGSWGINRIHKYYPLGGSISFDVVLDLGALSPRYNGFGGYYYQAKTGSPDPISELIPFRITDDTTRLTLNGSTQEQLFKYYFSIRCIDIDSGLDTIMQECIIFKCIGKELHTQIEGTPENNPEHIFIDRK
jgi:hypothetical protein